jgi:hypothetical protein
MTQEQRRRVLDRWYRERREILTEGRTEEEAAEKLEEDTKVKMED